MTDQDWGLLLVVLAAWGIRDWFHHRRCIKKKEKANGNGGR